MGVSGCPEGPGDLFADLLDPGADVVEDRRSVLGRFGTGTLRLELFPFWGFCTGCDSTIGAGGIVVGAGCSFTTVSGFCVNRPFSLPRIAVGVITVATVGSPSDPCDEELTTGDSTMLGR